MPLMEAKLLIAKSVFLLVLLAFYLAGVVEQGILIAVLTALLAADGLLEKITYDRVAKLEKRLQLYVECEEEEEE